MTLAEKRQAKRRKFIRDAAKKVAQKKKIVTPARKPRRKGTKGNWGQDMKNVTNLTDVQKNAVISTFSRPTRPVKVKVETPKLKKIKVKTKKKRTARLKLRLKR